MSDVWIRRANATSAGGYDYVTLAQIPLADASAFQASSLPSKGWAISSAPPTPTPPATVDAVGVMVFSGGPATPITATTQTLFNVNGTINPMVDARYEFAAAGPLSTPLLGANLNVGIRIGGVDVILTTPVGLLGSLAGTGWSLQGQVHFQTLTTVDADLSVQTFSALGTVKSILQVTSAPVTVPSGAQTAGISASWSTSGASLTANRISAERVQ